MRSANKYLKLILFWQGIGFLLISLTWIFDETASRLAGVAWLEEILEFIPWFTVDQKVGGLWLVTSILMILAGTRLSCKWRKLENIAFTAAISVPILLGLIFLAAFLFGDHGNGYITLFSYATFTAPLLAYLRLGRHEPSMNTSVMDALEDNGHEV